MQYVKIKSIKKIPKKDRYDLTVSSTHNFFANGILIHNTSGRIGHVQVQRDLGFIEKIAEFFGVKVNKTEWKYLNGTRRVVLEETTGLGYHDHTIRDKAFNLFEGKLRKGETVFFEIVGYEPTGVPIMGKVDTTKLNDKEFTKQYGKTMCYSYGCEPGQCEVYLYRMTITNEDGESLDYTWDDILRRAEEMGVKTVPHIRTLTFEELSEISLKMGGNPDDKTLLTMFMNEIENDVKGPSTLDPSHIREGVVVRIEGGLVNQSFKHKSYEFKVLEGVIKDSGVIDAEEVQDLS